MTAGQLSSEGAWEKSVQAECGSGEELRLNGWVNWVYLAREQRCGREQICLIVKPLFS